MLKRGFDIVASGVALVALLPLMLVLAILVRLDSPGPSLFRQTRVGKSFCEFQLLKFRSMRNGSCGTEVTCGQDARITRVGAFLRPDYEKILSVRPGITDPASIQYRSEAEILGRTQDPVNYYANVILPDKIEISRAYVRSANFWKDISLIFQTIAALFQK